MATGVAFQPVITLEPVIINRLMWSGVESARRCSYLQTGSVFSGVGGHITPNLSSAWWISPWSFQMRSYDLYVATTAFPSRERRLCSKGSMLKAVILLATGKCWLLELTCCAKSVEGLLLRKQASKKVGCSERESFIVNGDLRLPWTIPLLYLSSMMMYGEWMGEDL